MTDFTVEQLGAMIADPQSTKNDVVYAFQTVLDTRTDELRAATNRIAVLEEALSAAQLNLRWKTDQADRSKEIR